jgi:hypothetical protein
MPRRFLIIATFILDAMYFRHSLHIKILDFLGHETLLQAAKGNPPAFPY